MDALLNDHERSVLAHLEAYCIAGSPSLPLFGSLAHIHECFNCLVIVLLISSLFCAVAVALRVAPLPLTLARRSPSSLPIPNPREA